MDMNALLQCVDEIAAFFLSDTLEDFDAVLCEDAQDPVRSANTVRKRLEKYALYRSLTLHRPPDSILTVLDHAGYPSDAVRSFLVKCRQENERHIKICSEQGYDPQKYIEDDFAVAQLNAALQAQR